MTGDSKEARSTRIRAAIMKFLNSNSGREFTLADIMRSQADLIEELEYKDTNIYTFLNQMGKHKQINVRKVGHLNMYSSVKQSVDSTEIAATEVVPATKPHLAIDIVKSTGRVRLEFGGMVIEIGVKE